MSVIGELDRDVMECGDPESAWAEAIKFFRWRASAERGISHDLQVMAQAASEDATIHAARAQEFTQLADAMEQAPVAFAADETPNPPLAKAQGHD